MAPQPAREGYGGPDGYGDYAAAGNGERPPFPKRENEADPAPVRPRPEGEREENRKFWLESSEW